MMDTFECIMKEKIFLVLHVFEVLEKAKFVETFYNQNIQDH